MRIAFLTTLFMPCLGGAEIFLHHLANDMILRGHHSVVIAPGSRKHRHAFKMTYPYMRTFRARSKRFMVGNALPALLAAHMLHRFDFVHCQGEYHETMAAYYFRRMTGVPYVCRPIGGGFTNAEAHPRVQQKLLKSLSNASLVFAQGDFLKQRIENNGIQKEKIVTINNGVRIEEIRSHKNDSPMVKPPYLFYAGGLKTVKGYDIALKAFARIAALYPALKLVMMGIDQRKDHFDQLVRDLALGDRVIFMHWCNRQTTARLFCHASIYLCPFRRSPFSNANLEAMAAGVPIIATAVEGNLEQIRDGVEGYLVPPDDAGSMALKIDHILSNPELHGRLGENASARSRMFSWQSMVDRYECQYKQVLDYRRLMS
jgi:glycosyltransferase involved in cell wall biosynthesis